MKKLGPQLCYEQLQPLLSEIHRMIRTAPVADNEKAGLAVMVAAYFFGVAGGALGKVGPTYAREVCDIIIATLDTAAPPLKVVQ